MKRFARHPITAVAIAATLCAVAGAPAVAQDGPAAVEGDGQSSIMLLFDASGSMAADDGSGNRRIDTARSAITELIEGAPEEARIGLRVFGGRFARPRRRQGCQDSRALFPVGELDPERARQAVQSYRPIGYTPIALSLERAARDLPPDGARTIILVSDGEDTCQPPPPCEVAERIARQGVALKIQAIGFQVNPRARAQLQCIARVSGGIYRDVEEAERLAEELRALSVRALRDYVAEGEPVEGGPTAREAAEIGPGQFVDTIGPDEERWFAVELSERETLQAAATLVPEDRFGLETSRTEFTMEIVNPAFEEPDTNNSGASGGSSVFGADSEGAVDSLGVVGRPVGVGDQADETAVQTGFGRAGTYYLRVRLADNDSRELLNKLEGGRVDLELLVNVIGRENGQAQPPSEDGSEDGGGGGESPDVTESAAAGASDDGPAAILLALISLGAVAVGIGGAIGVTRARRA
jgi:Ca-activated chloride channel family protein